MTNFLIILQKSSRVGFRLQDVNKAPLAKKRKIKNEGKGHRVRRQSEKSSVIGESSGSFDGSTASGSGSSPAPQKSATSTQLVVASSQKDANVISKVSPANEKLRTMANKKSNTRKRTHNK